MRHSVALTSLRSPNRREFAKSNGGGALTNLVSSNASSQANSIAAQDLGIRLAAASNTRATRATTRASSNRATTRAKQKATSTRKANTRATQTRTAQSKSKAQVRQEAQNREFGLMPSEIDGTNHSVFHADAAAIRGARDTESALRYMPFVTIVNTAGFGSSFDLRGQGRLSANGVKLFLNGIPATPVDSYFNAMPINTILPQLIQEVSVTPGGGAVLYGSGAKGGTINIVTSQRSAPYFLVGAGYVNTMATTGNSFNAFAQAAENFGPHLKANAGLAGSVLGGPREDDQLINAQAVLGAWYDIGWGQSVSVDADAFFAKNKTTPYNSLLDFTNINRFMLRTTSSPVATAAGGAMREAYEEIRYRCLTGSPLCTEAALEDFKPDSSNRGDKGYGTIDTTQIRGTAKVDYISQLTQKLKVGATAFADFQSMKYNDYKMNLPFFVLGYVDPKDKNNRGYNWFLARPTNPIRTGEISSWLGMTPNTNAGNYLIGAEGPLFTQYKDLAGNVFEADGERADWQFLDQTGSKFDDYKMGGKARIDWDHDNGHFIFGMDFYYEMSKRNSKTYLRQAITDGSAQAGIAGYDNNGVTDPSLKFSSVGFSTLVANIINKTDINVLTTAAYIYETYNLNRNFSIGAGMRYEMKNYDVKITDNFEGYKLQFQDTAQGNSQGCPGSGSENQCDFVDYSSGKIYQTTNKAGENNLDGIATSEAKGEYNQNHDNFTFELAPVYRYSNTGAIYARGEFGYNAPPAWAMLRRIGIVWGASRQRDIWFEFTNQAGGDNDTRYGKVLEFDFDFENTNLKNETYYTAELGWKEMIGSRRVPLGITNLTINALLFNASVFYTASQNEFYFEGDTWSGMTFGNYDKSRRMGVELAAEQYLFGGALGINESFTYLKAQKDQGEGWSPIPYTYDWKATLGAAVNISTFLEVVDVDVSVWLQNSIYGNQNIYSTQMNVLTNAQAKALATANGQTITSIQEPYFVSVKEDKKLDPYLVSDFGVSVGINKNMGVITVGIKNLFDTFYYDYYNNDRSAVVNENRYVIGRGRTVFVEGTFRY